MIEKLLNEEQIEIQGPIEKEGIFESVENYGFLRCKNFTSSSDDVYIPVEQVTRFRLRNGDKVKALVKDVQEDNKVAPAFFIKEINDKDPRVARKVVAFEKLRPIYPNRRMTLGGTGDVSLRLMDIISPVGFGQRGLIVSPPKAGKTRLIKSIANSIMEFHKDVELMIVLIDERPEEVSDIQDFVHDKANVIYSTFDERADNHVRMAEMAIERAKRLVEDGKDVVILLDSITRLARAYNILEPSSGRLLSGGLDPMSLYKPKKFFGAARNIEGKNMGSLTIIATALVETGSRMDDVIYEEFKGTGNMELHLDRQLANRGIFPAIDIIKSGTRNEDIIQNTKEMDARWYINKALSVDNSPEMMVDILSKLSMTENNDNFVDLVSKIRFESGGNK